MACFRGARLLGRVPWSLLELVELEGTRGGLSGVGSLWRRILCVEHDPYGVDKRRWVGNGAVGCPLVPFVGFGGAGCCLRLNPGTSSAQMMTNGHGGSVP